MIIFLSFISISEIPNPYQKPGIINGCPRLLKLNPIFWLPTPITTPSHRYFLIKCYVGPALYIEGDLLTTLITLPYWLVLSYLLSCLIIWIYDKVKKKS